MCVCRRCPYLSGATVECEVVKQGRGKKIRVFKYEPKKQFHRVKGHRQSYTKLLVKAINVKAKAKKAKAEAQEVKEENQE